MNNFLKENNQLFKVYSKKYYLKNRILNRTTPDKMINEINYNNNF